MTSGEDAAPDPKPAAPDSGPELATAYLPRAPKEADALPTPAPRADPPATGSSDSGSENATTRLKSGPRAVYSHYEVLGRLGQGGMGEVLLAVDTKLGRKVAIKTLPSDVVDDEERLARFRREAKALAALNHPNIVTVHAVEESEGHHFLVMELVEGSTLRRADPGQGFPLDEFYDAAVPLADALANAHERGITHRDLKPENVMVTRSGRLKVLDFGLAKPQAEGASTVSGKNTLTQRGIVLGTVPYMSPEQVRGLPLDHRSDIFSLGIMMYEMLAGERPFGGETQAEVISAILRDAPRPLSELRGDLPPELEELIFLCLEKRLEDRIQTTQELHDRLRALQKGLEFEIQASTTGRRAAAVTRPVATASWTDPGTWLHGRLGCTLLLVAAFVVNYLETTLETAVRTRFQLGLDWAEQLAHAAQWLEGRISFARHDATNPVAVYGYSTSYFLLLPAMGLFTLAVLARRENIRAYRVHCLSVAITYALSLPFWIFFPVPERWAFRPSGAILLSDLWTSKLIEAFRPISGLHHCFPSFHVSLTVCIVGAWFLFRLRGRWSMAFLGATIVLSTFVLGIHWIPDMISGAAMGVLGLALARRVDRSWSPRGNGAPAHTTKLLTRPPVRSSGLTA